jgi:hypothetical protein
VELTKKTIAEATELEETGNCFFLSGKHVVAFGNMFYSIPFEIFCQFLTWVSLVIFFMTCIIYSFFVMVSMFETNINWLSQAVGFRIQIHNKHVGLGRAAQHLGALALTA